MKNYTLTIKDLEERKQRQRKFILGYEIKEDKTGEKIMIIRYADGRKGQIANSSAFEKAILALMECQVKKYEPSMLGYEQDYKTRLNSLNLENRLGILAVYIIVMIGMMSTIGIGMSLLLAMGAIFLLGSLTIDISTVIKQKKLINDFNKMLLFTQNEKKINQNILARDNKFIREINDVLDKICVEMPNGQMGITINSLDKISLKKLEKVVKNINLKENFEIIEQVYEKKKAIVLEKGKEIERQVREEKRRPFESLLTIEDVAKLRSIDELHYQYRLNDENKSSFINVCDRYSSMVDLDLLERKSKTRVRRK